MPTSNIILPEHNSSRLLFIDNQDPNFNLQIENLEQDSSEKDKCNCSDPKFLLGQLNNYIWLLEDSSEYDTNHTHKAKLNYTNQYNNSETFFDVKRIMEYSQECDRLYTSHSGGLKFVLLDSPTENQTIELFIKYERTLPGFEKITDLQNTQTGETYPACLVFFRYNSTNNTPQMIQVVQLVAGLNVLDSNTLQPMNNINYCSINIKNINIDFNQLKFIYTIDPNTTNDIKIGFIGTSSLFTNPNNGNYGKFISQRYYENNDSFIEPGVFLIQAPKNRSWICYRTCYNSGFSPGILFSEVTKSNLTNHSYEYTTKYKDGHKCYYLNRASLNGYNGTLENNKYIYEVNIDRNSEKNVFILMIPTMFTDYESLQYLDNNNNVVSSYMDLGANEFNDTEIVYNELDGMFYKTIVIPIIRSYCKIYKVKLTYNKQ